MKYILQQAEMRFELGSGPVVELALLWRGEKI